MVHLYIFFLFSFPSHFSYIKCSGCVIDLISCDSQYNRAVEVIAEGRLFYHVVETDQIAMKILERINRRDLHGEVNFYPLNRIIAKARRPVEDKV